jgi:hypothetical protein
MMRSGPKPVSLRPELARFVVGGHAVLAAEDRDDELLGRQRELAGDEAPREADRLGLEVVAEREVAQHLEERVVARGDADVLEVVVLAADADALLAVVGALVAAHVLAGEDVLELHHARVGEHQRRVVAGHQRARRDALVRSHDRAGARAGADAERPTRRRPGCARRGGGRGGRWSARRRGRALRTVDPLVHG